MTTRETLRNSIRIIAQVLADHIRGQEGPADSLVVICFEALDQIQTHWEEFTPEEIDRDPFPSGPMDLASIDPEEKLACALSVTPEEWEFLQESGGESQVVEWLSFSDLVAKSILKQQEHQFAPLSPELQIHKLRDALEDLPPFSPN